MNVMRTTTFILQVNYYPTIYDEHEENRFNLGWENLLKFYDEYGERFDRNV